MIFVLKRGHLGYYGMRLWILFKLSLSAGFLRDNSSRPRGGRAASLLPDGAEVRVPHVASGDTEVGEGHLLLLAQGGSSTWLGGTEIPPDRFPH